MATKAEHCAAYDARQREKGMVRGPRITAAAADKLRRLAYINRMTPSQVVSQLLESADLPHVASFQEREGLSDAEMRELPVHQRAFL